MGVDEEARDVEPCSGPGTALDAADPRGDETEMKRCQQQSHAHHYVPQWYQRRFMLPGQSEFFLLDLHPAVTVHHGVSHKHRDSFRSVPKRCFFEDDLYTLAFDRGTSDEMERWFFGKIDSMGHAAVSHVADFQGVTESVTRGAEKTGMDAFRDLPAYMGAQRFRVPRGLDEIKTRAAWQDDRQKNKVLTALASVFQSYTTMWMEGVWEIVRARQSATKFIVTDDPVTLYCKLVFTSEWRYPNDVNLKQIGSRTIFALGLDSCLIITHLQLVRNPWSTPTEFRENARSYDQTMMPLGSIQFGRELEESEVLRINHILKTRATRYIAAAKEEWLYPERDFPTTEWKNLDDDWFLLPNPWKVQFTTGLAAGGKNWAWARDEYGLPPGDPRYQDKKRREREWQTRERAQREWAKKRLGKSLAHIDKFWHDDVEDEIMKDYLRGEGLFPPEQPREVQPVKGLNV